MDYQQDVFSASDIVHRGFVAAEYMSANNQPLCTRELNKCSVTGQTH